jgi:hypothetical protein
MANVVFCSKPSSMRLLSEGPAVTLLKNTKPAAVQRVTLTKKSSG